MTRLQAAFLELRKALGDRPWVLIYDPCDPTSQDWGFSLEHSSHPGYVRVGLVKMAAEYLDEKLIRSGRQGTPLSERLGHRFEGPEQVCSRCGLSRLSAEATGQECAE